MCGIIGILHRAPGSIPSLTHEHLARLSHRGPDGQGLLVEGQMALGHTRLSIIDLSNLGAQPMTYADGRFAVTFNGEIYNYLELRDELATQGARFTSRSDTEVILAAYQAWGDACVGRFRGMFAFAIWDKAARTLFLARDRCGEKPLFYWHDADRFAFASELKALRPLLPHRPGLNPTAVDMYLHFQYTPEPFTLLEGVRKLPAAHVLTLSLEDWNAAPRRYWNIEDASPLYGDPAGIVREELERAVTLTLRSDVPVGVALSGGIDSGAIAALAARHYSEPMHAFCVGYPGRPPYDEREQARELAGRLNMIFHEVELPVDQFVAFFPQLVRIMDEPIADPAAFGHYSVPKAAADLGIKVLLTGIGGDELFWGYSWTARAVHINRLRSLLASLPKPLRLLIPAAARAAAGLSCGRYTPDMITDAACSRTPRDQPIFMTTTNDFVRAFDLKPSVYGPAMADILAGTPFAPTAIGPRNREKMPTAVLRLLFETWLVSNCLSLGDRVSMAVGVETRLPFLDCKLIETVMGLRAGQPDHSLEHKAWLRSALVGILPAGVLGRPKRGFQPPVWEWLTGVVGAYGDSLPRGRLVDEGIVDARRADAALREFPARGWPELFFLYKLVLLEQWAETM